MKDHLTPQQYVKWCMMQEMDADTYNTQYPHPYLILWLECRRRAQHTGYREYPEPEKSFLHQDADLMLAFEVLDECNEEQQKIEEARNLMIKESQALG